MTKYIAAGCDYRDQNTQKCVCGQATAVPRPPHSWLFMGRFRGRRGEGKKGKAREWDGKREREGGAFPHFLQFNH